MRSTSRVQTKHAVIGHVSFLIALHKIIVFLQQPTKERAYQFGATYPVVALGSIFLIATDWKTRDVVHIRTFLVDRMQ